MAEGRPVARLRHPVVRHPSRSNNGHDPDVPVSPAPGPHKMRMAEPPNVGVGKIVPCKVIERYDDLTHGGIRAQLHRAEGDKGPRNHLAGPVTHPSGADEGIDKLKRL